ncbi:IS30 family transposase [Arthrobacter sp. LjRoot14]|uniref:IS30 family transposase n=1 Tax=Arthrobacter sp. LjRoot14 TaxID=3342265 RepID=UPI003ED0D419
MIGVVVGRFGRPEVLCEVVRAFWTARSSGLSDEVAAGVAGLSATAAGKIVRQHGGVDPSKKPPCGRYLSFDERELIAVWRAAGCGVREIGRRLGRNPSTVSRELGRNIRNEGKRPYLASSAQNRAQKLARRPKARKLAVNEALALYVGGMLTCRERLSPEQISARLPIDFPDDESMRISHETIYQCIYIQGRGGLRAELATALRTGRAVRQPNRRAGTRRPRVPKELLISERPAEADDRAVPGHWEGDLIIGTPGTGAIGTLVERRSRFVMLLHLPNGHTGEQVLAAIEENLPTLPAQLRRSLTWDQGAEMVGIHDRVRIATGADVYFCDPHSPWQRGTNENTNGLLRQYFPKGMDLTTVTRADLDYAAAGLNGRLRKTLGWKTPAQALEQIMEESAA